LQLAKADFSGQTQAALLQLPLAQPVPSLSALCTQPLFLLQLSAVQGLWSSQSAAVVPVAHLPRSQASSVVQPSPSLQGELNGRAHTTQFCACLPLTSFQPAPSVISA